MATKRGGVKVRILLFLCLVFSLLVAADLHILFSNSENGHIHGCRCPVNPKSGLIKRAAFIRSYRQKYPDRTLLLTSGDLFYLYPNKPRAQQMLSSLASLDYDAVTLGDQDFVNGLDFLEEMQKELPLLAANVSYKKNNQKKSLDGHLIRKVNGVRVAVIGVVQKKFFNYPHLRQIKNKLYIENARSVLKQQLTQVKNKSDIILLLSHLGIETDRKIAADFPELDIIIGGHSQYLTSKPNIINNVIILQAGGKGNFQGELKLTLDSEHKISDHEVIFHFFRYDKNTKKDKIIGSKTFTKYTYKIHDGTPDDKIIKKIIHKARQNSGH
ncbi:MAG TPA: hypothetical protein VKS21_12505 [Spirochaetota bacterium]|nr:hypothetical protein [Spirochaetota bacterium]